MKKKELIKKIDFYLNKLFNINRSITGPGNRQTLKEIKKIIPIKIKSVKSGLIHPFEMVNKLVIIIEKEK